jgi:methylmalonyl-CoA/ethylmalonyl-CoA epimerase
VIKKIDHVILVVNNLEKAMETFQGVLRTTPEEGGFKTELPKFRVAMFPPIGGTRIELIEPKKDIDSRFSRFLKEHGEGAMGVSFFVDGYDEQVKTIKEQGLFYEEETQVDLFPEHPFRICWVPPKDSHGVWLEFVGLEELPDFEQ